MKFNTLFITILLLLLSGCATSINFSELSKEEKDYIGEVRKAGPTLTLKLKDEKEVWSRANSFILRFSGMRIQATNESIIQTYSPNAIQNGTIGYTVFKEISGDTMKVHITCEHKSMNFIYTDAICENNVKLMSYYLETGKLMEKFVDSSIVDTEGTDDSKGSSTESSANI